GPGGQAGRGDEAFDGAGDEEDDGETDGHGERGPALFGEGLAAKARAGIDQGPAKTQPGAGGDEDRGQFEEAVGQYEAEEGVEPARRTHQPEADAQVEHVLEEDPDHRPPEEDAKDEAEEIGRATGRERA